MLKIFVFLRCANDQLGLIFQLREQPLEVQTKINLNYY